MRRGNPYTGFNPCRVFKSAATDLHEVARGQAAWFQSLSGFQVRCNCFWGLNYDTEVEVSIPVGFSSPLQRQSRYNMG